MKERLSGWIDNFVESFPELLFMHSAGIQMTYYLKQTWFMSALFLAFAVFYPILLKHKENYIYIGAPVVAALTLGYISKSTGCLLVDVGSLLSFLTKGVFRAVAEINLGIFVYGVVICITKRKLTRLGKVAFSIVAVFSLWKVLDWVVSPSEGTEMDFAMVFMIAAIILSLFVLSQNGMFTGKSKICSLAGKISLFVFFSHRIVLDYFMPLIQTDLIKHCMVYETGVLILSVLIYALDYWLVRLFKKTKFKIYEEQ